MTSKTGEEGRALSFAEHRALLAWMGLPALAAIAICLRAAAPLAAHGGGLEEDSGETLFSQGTSISLGFIRERKLHPFEGSHRVPNPLGQVEEEERVILGLAYGVTQDLTLSLLVPYVDHEEREDSPTGRHGVGADGIGDVTLLGKYLFFFTGGEGTEATASVIGGLQLPSGATDARDPGGALLDPDLQPGTGAFNGIVGLAGTAEWGRLEVDGFVVWQRTGEGSRRFRQEDLLEGGAKLVWRPWIEKYPGPELGVSVKVWWEHESHAVDHGDRVHDSGGDTLFVTPGVSFSPRAGWTLNVGVDLPAYRDLNGEQLGLDLRTTVGVSITF